MDVLEKLSDKYGDIKRACIALDITEQTVWNWKTGKTKINGKNAEKIAKDLNLAISTVKRSINKREE